MYYTLFLKLAMHLLFFTETTPTSYASWHMFKLATCVVVIGENASKSNGHSSYNTNAKCRPFVYTVAKYRPFVHKKEYEMIAHLFFFAVIKCFAYFFTNTVMMFFPII